PHDIDDADQHQGEDADGCDEGEKTLGGMHDAVQPIDQAAAGRFLLRSPVDGPAGFTVHECSLRGRSATKGRCRVISGRAPRSPFSYFLAAFSATDSTRSSTPWASNLSLFSATH